MTGAAPKAFMAARPAFKALLAALAAACAMEASALTCSNRYRSPRNPERRIRASTRLVVLHTTEAHARSSLNKLCERGEAHYCVTEDGTVYRIIDRDRVAFHAGRSMWNGKEDCDEYSIGIEVVGYHDRPVTQRQLAALRELLSILKKMYSLGDGQIVCHSHVAYGAPNKWQKRRHRGRKRCGMLFAMWSVRKSLGLSARPAADPDVKAGRLVQADPYLQKVLYGSADTMVAHYRAGRDPGKKSDSGGGFLSGIGELFGFGEEKKTPAKKPEKKIVKKPDKKPPAATAAKQKAPAKPKKKDPAPAASTPDAWRSAAKFVPAAGGTTDQPVWYILPDGKYFRDDKLPKSVKLAPGTKKLAGYSMGGPLGAGQSAYGVAGKAWNLPTTYYVFGGKVRAGDTLTAKEIPRGAVIFHKTANAAAAK